MRRAYVKILNKHNMLKRQTPIHRWYCINEMLPIELVKRFVMQSSGPVLDPFLGVGTVLVEARRANIDSIGVDINPFMCFTSKVKVGNYNSEALQEALSEIRMDTEIDIDECLLSARLCRYYSPSILQKLLAIKTEISKLRQGWAKDAITLSFVETALKAANVRKSPAPRFTSPKVDYPVFETFWAKAMDMVEDLKNLKDASAQHHVLIGDSRDLSFLDDRFDLVLTSPPYCNNLDFVRHTQLELYWMGFALNSSDLGELRRSCITSCEAMAHVGKEDTCILQEVHDIAAVLGKKTERRLPEVIIQYFSGMETHLRNIQKVLRRRSKCVYVVGDSKMKDIYIPTHELLCKIAKSVGFNRVKISYLRKRFHYGSTLGEYLIEMAN